MCFEEVGLICLGKVAIWKPWWRINQGSGDNGSINNSILSCGCNVRKVFHVFLNFSID